MKMKGSKSFFLLVLLVFLTFSLTACGAAKTSGESAASTSVTENSGSNMSGPVPAAAGEQSKKDGNTNGEKMINAKITVGEKVFAAKLYDNETSRALIEKLPMTVNMTELNGREKYYNLPENLPANSTEIPATIHAGEIMRWSSNCLVLFYKTYPNSYSGYIKLGYIGNISGLNEALGEGNVQVTFEASN